MQSYVLDNSKWGSSILGSAGGQVTWSFAATSRSDGYQFDRQISEPGFQALLRQAFDSWEAVADIDFVEVADGLSTNIKLGWDAIDGAFGTVGQARTWSISDDFYDAANVRFSTSRSDIRFDTAEDWSLTRAPAFNKVDFFSVALHEIGHSIGLDHTDDPMTIMFPMVPDIFELTPGDITGVQLQYGPAQSGPETTPTLAQLFASHTDIAKGYAAAYQVLLDGLPSAEGFQFLIDATVSSNFGAGPGVVFNEENIYINIANALYQGNATAAANFNALASGSTLSEKVTSLYAALISPGDQTAESLAYLTREEGLTFYQQTAAERGVSGADGAAIVALGSLLKIAVTDDSGVGDAVNDLAMAIASGSAAVPQRAEALTAIEIADGTAFDGDDDWMFSTAMAIVDQEDAPNLIGADFSISDAAYGI